MKKNLLLPIMQMNIDVNQICYTLKLILYYSALAPRMITSIWWFFTMVMVASYTGTLVAFLTVEKDVLPFQNAEELFLHKSISYGAKEKGSTIDFFKVHLLFFK